VFFENDVEYAEESLDLNGELLAVVELLETVAVPLVIVELGVGVAVLSVARPPRVKVGPIAMPKPFIVLFKAASLLHDMTPGAWFSCIAEVLKAA
jgi:hypothetical protein